MSSPLFFSNQLVNMTFRNRENVFVFHASKWIAIVIRPSLNTNLSFQLENASKSDKKTISNSPGKSSNRIPHLELFGNIRDLRMFKIQSILAHKLLLVNETNNGETKQVIFNFPIFPSSYLKQMIFPCFAIQSQMDPWKRFSTLFKVR